MINQRIYEAGNCFAGEVRVRQQRRDAIAGELSGLRTSWIPDSQGFAVEWRNLFDSLERAKHQYEALRREYDNELAKKQANQREAQFRDFLDQILIADESIPNFKKGRKAMLAANGFETAWDVTEQALERLQGQGLGPKLISQLLDWRREQERRFHFNPGKGMPAGEIRSLHAQFQARRQTLQRILRGGREQAEAIQLKASRRLQELQRRANEVIATLAQADADLALCWSISGHPSI
jgi:DNA-binding helix-hairpin-helix protein with protein kinase domain